MPTPMWLCGHRPWTIVPELIQEVPSVAYVTAGQCTGC